MEKSKKKKKKKKKRKKNFSWDVSPCDFSIPDYTRAEKEVVLFISVWGEEKCEINYKKVEKIFFLL